MAFVATVQTCRPGPDVMRSSTLFLESSYPYHFHLPRKLSIAAADSSIDSACPDESEAICHVPHHHKQATNQHAQRLNARRSARTKALLTTTLLVSALLTTTVKPKRQVGQTSQWQSTCHANLFTYTNINI